MKEKVMSIFLFITAALAITGCDNIFHDMKEDQFYPPATSLLYPGIEYTYPKDGATDMPINRQVLVSFSEDMDFSGLAGDEFSIVKEGDPLPISATITPYSKRILLISPASDLDPVSHYTVTLEKSLPGANGLEIPKGYSWSFDTSALSDIDPPTVIKITPPDKAVVGIFSMRTITIEFNEDMDPTTINNATVKLQKDGAVPVDINGDISYSVISLYGATHRMATFSPESSSIEGKADYILTISGVRDLAGNFLNPAPVTSRILTGILEVDLEDAQNINHGSASFGRNGNRGKLLLNSFGQYLEDLFAGDVSMDSVFDTGTSGPLGSDKSVRIVVGGKNIMTGIGPDNVILSPIKKDLSSALVSPPANQCYIDPREGRFVLPRPIFWSTMGSRASITDPEIFSYNNPALVSSRNHSITFVPGMWGNCLNVGSSNSFYGSDYLYPFGESFALTLRCGTASLWFKVDQTLLVTAQINVFIGDVGNYVQVADNVLKVVCGGIVEDSRSVSFVNSHKWHHLYVVWDYDRHLAGTASVRAFVDGNEVSTVVPPGSGQMFISVFINNTGSVIVNMKIDNLKIWNHVVSEDPQWEYNGGIGRERALHYIYGPDADQNYDYRPRLIGPDPSTDPNRGGVGYFH